MLKATDIKELAKRMKPGEASFRNIRGAYVDAKKKIVTYVKEDFWKLEEDKYHKYLEIAKGIMSSKVNNNMLSLDLLPFNIAYDGIDRLIETNMKDEAALAAVFQTIIDKMYFVGNYLILLYNDTYDIPVTAKDGTVLEDSEEVYSYILCAICPVQLTSAGLEYNEKKNTIEPRERDWLVLKPCSGFIYPAFEERTVERDHILYFTKDALNPDHDFIKDGIGASDKKTATELRWEFEDIFFQVTGSENEKKALLPPINAILKRSLEAMEQNEKEKYLLQSARLDTALKVSDIDSTLSSNILSKFEEKFPYGVPLEYIVNAKYAQIGEKQEKKKRNAQIIAEAAHLLDELTEDTELVEKLKSISGQERT